MVWLIRPQNDPASINRILRGISMSAPAPTYTRYRVAAIQYEPTLGEKEKNVTDLLHLVQKLLLMLNQFPAQLPTVFSNSQPNMTVTSPLALLRLTLPQMFTTTLWP